MDSYPTQRRQGETRSGRDGAGRAPRAGMDGFRAVAPPPRHEGMTNALHRAFAEAPGSLPAEMERLLHALN